MGTLQTPTSGVRLADASKVFLGTISVANTRRGYAVGLDRLVRGFGADGNVALLDPDRVARQHTSLARHVRRQRPQRANSMHGGQIN